MPVTVKLEEIQCAQGMEQTVLAGIVGCVSDTGKERCGIRISHSDAVFNIREHGKVVVAVAEGICIGAVQPVIIQDIFDACGFRVADGNKLPESSASVDAGEILVTDLPESIELLRLAVPDYKFVTEEVGIFKIQCHFVMAGGKGVKLPDCARMLQRSGVSKHTSLRDSKRRSTSVFLAICKICIVTSWEQGAYRTSAPPQ